MTKDNAFIEHLLASYKFSSEASKNLPLQESRHWQRFNSQFRKLEFDNLLKELSNFRLKKSLSEGMDDALDRGLPEQFFKIIKEVDVDLVLNNLSSKNIGNSDRCIEFQGKFIDYGDLFHIYIFSLLKDFIFDQSKIRSICEIGGGYGALARIIASNVGVPYILIDLPETNLLSSYYLYEHNKLLNKKFLTHIDIKDNILTKNHIQNSDFIIIPPNVSFDNDVEIDLFINSRSMMEMNKEVITEYFKLIQEHISPSGYFLNINRYYKDTVGTGIRLIDYPYDNKWEIVDSRQVLFYEHIHGLITKRISMATDEITDHLKSLQKITQLHTPNPLFRILKKNLRQIISFIFPKKIKTLIKKVLIEYTPE
jgi:putative sugar O-methyltransferase